MPVFSLRVRAACWCACVCLCECVICNFCARVHERTFFLFLLIVVFCYFVVSYECVCVCVCVCVTVRACCLLTCVFMCMVSFSCSFSVVVGQNLYHFPPPICFPSFFLPTHWRLLLAHTTATVVFVCVRVCVCVWSALFMSQP